ncbi:hypothetical protein FNW02_22930 [Komarekiella sp. 'clone 1']|uniref:Uncharacterized protein n=1 Tax=Komarekiella delphini-convector SJRDD-AB1 TaxID=2593771 RepID=A0AA40VT17_9NOST|nr:hypothetical protein [Komarekiella delphini-convector]MBD6618602.1 hypothetical protein [Komarekiella delphini-convector SJRDD-AB1]
MSSAGRGISKITNSVLKGSGSFKRATFTTLNVEKLKGVLSYFSYLHANGEISDKAFENLVCYACSIFIENEVEEIVQETLERKLVQFLQTKLSLIDEDNSDIEQISYALKAARLIRSR